MFKFLGQLETRGQNFELSKILATNFRIQTFIIHSECIVTESKSILMHSYAFETYSGFWRAKTRKGNREEGNEGPDCVTTQPSANAQTPEAVKKWQIQ